MNWSKQDVDGVERVATLNRNAHQQTRNINTMLQRDRSDYAPMCPNKQDKVPH
jgi:hypothetical protein